jgi:hypothetical protein
LCTPLQQISWERSELMTGKELAQSMGDQFSRLQFALWCWFGGRQVHESILFLRQSMGSRQSLFRRDRRREDSDELKQRHGEVLICKWCVRFRVRQINVRSASRQPTVFRKPAQVPKVDTCAPRVLQQQCKQGFNEPSSQQY